MYERKIVLIDDDPFALKLLVHQLNRLGHNNLILFTRANEALDMIKQQNIELIFCDLQMPEMDGIEFLRHLAKADFIGSLVLISGEDERILDSAYKLANAHSLNILDVLSKPVSTVKLKEILKQKTFNYAKTGSKGLKKYASIDIQRAIKNNELVNYYQPKVKVLTGEISGVETLVRWEHPTDGLVQPVQFISLAEDLGLIDELTWVVLKNSLAQLNRWNQTRPSFNMAINISMDNLRSLNFPDMLINAIREADVSLTNITLEVTESKFMSDRLVSLDVLTRLRLKKLSLSIDDFGTGHSSLSQLFDVPFDELKIDRQFVHDAWKDRSRQAIYQASINMAKQLQIRTVAEGVEDMDDWNFLRENQCDLAQGFFIAKPMPLDHFETWEVNWNKRRELLMG